MAIIYTNYKRSKQNKKPGWKQREAEYQKHLKSLGIDSSTKKKRKAKFVPLQQKESIHARQSREHREKYPSADLTSASIHATAKKERQEYTGTLIKGIATMHKSNAVPVIDAQQAKDISAMGR